jgi:hypothetical protein
MQRAILLPLVLLALSARSRPPSILRYGRAAYITVCNLLHGVTIFATFIVRAIRKVSPPYREKSLIVWTCGRTCFAVFFTPGPKESRWLSHPRSDAALSFERSIP